MHGWFFVCRCASFAALAPYVVVGRKSVDVFVTLVARGLEIVGDRVILEPVYVGSSDLCRWMFGRDDVCRAQFHGDS